MSSKIDAALREQLHAPEDWPFNVEIEFDQEPPEEEVRAMRMGREGRTVWGTMTRRAIEGVAENPHVVSIRLSRRQPPDDPPRKAQIGARLELEMQQDPGPYFVAVTFRGRGPSAADFPSLSVHLDIGTGMLTRKQILDLARRGDVVSIDSIPPSKLF